MGLCTPLFAIAGVVGAFHRVLPRHPLVQFGVLVCAGGGVGTVVYNHVGPFLANHSEVVLPFAAANGLASMFWFSVLEAKLGLEAMAGALSAEAAEGLGWWGRQLMRYGLPLGGPAVGVLTACSAGYLYPLVARLVWPADLQEVLGPSRDGVPSFSWMVDLHHWLLVPVSIPVGLVSGYGLHVALGPVLLGTVRGGLAPWTSVALPALGGLAAAAGVYFTQCGCYDANALFWERRVDFKTGKTFSFNLRTGEARPGPERAFRSLTAGAGADAFAALRTGLVSGIFNEMWAMFWGSGDGGGGSLVPVEALPREDGEVSYWDLGRHQRLHLMLDLLVRLK